MLTRKSVLDRSGPLDENLKAVAEHADFCLTVRRAGGTVIFEPNAVVTYVVGPPLALSDIPYLLPLERRMGRRFPNGFP